MTEHDPNASPKPVGAPERGGAPGLIDIDVREWGGKKDGERQVLDQRLFMQLTVWSCETAKADERSALFQRLKKDRVASVVYDDVNAPARIGVLAWTAQPEELHSRLAPVLRDELVGRGWRQCNEFTMLGRTYALGHEPDLEHALLQRPVEYVLHQGWDWAVWYPLRRNGAFEQLEKHDQGIILKEHATIGMSYGRKDLAHDVRLACHGLDAGDNEFVIGLVGKDLHPLSHVVQSMRHTRQTSEFIAQMGPFFVGRAVFREAGGPK
jgi:chlorite dismutase